MRYGVFSDVHSNLEAFGVALEFYKKEKIDKFIYLGDIVGYGANPNECIELLKKLNPICIAGNHDWAAIGKFDPRWFNAYAREAIFWTKHQLEVDKVQYLTSLELIHREEYFICVHGSLEDPQDFRYILDSYDASRSFTLQKSQICFIGHSHRMEAYSLKEEELSCMRDFELELDKDTKYIINVGSIGQPRDGDPRLSLCIYDSDQGVVKFIRLDYNIKKAADKILEKGLPKALAYRLYDGR